MGIGRIWKRDNIWYYAWSHRGREHRRSSHSEIEAVARRLLQQAYKNIGAGHDPTEDKLKFEGMVQRLMLSPKTTVQKRIDIEQRVKHLSSFFAGWYAPEITTSAVDRYIKLRSNAKPATVNRELACLRRMMRVSEVSKLPTFNMLPENNTRRDFLDAGDFYRVLAEIPENYRDFISFLYLSSWRQGQLAALEWRDVAGDQITARAETTKQGKDHPLPLTGELAAIIGRARSKRRLDCPFVFHEEGNRMDLGGRSKLRRAWRTATEVCGFRGYVIHCLRRSGIRNMIRAGTDPMTAMAVSGHRTQSMLTRYNIITAEDMDAALKNTFVQISSTSGGKNPVVVPIAVNARKD